MNIIKTPQNNIEVFLYDEVNIEILEYLISLKYKGRLEPLEYFNLLFSEFDFFIKNSSDYLKITERFVFPTIDELDMFEIKAINNSIIYAGLTKLISKHIYSVNCNEVVRKSCEYITKINDFIIDYGYKDSIRPNSFDIVKQHYKDLEYSVQIEKWTDSKFDILQGKGEHYFSKDEAKSFVENIDFEIQRLKDLIENKKELMTTSKIEASSTDLFNNNMSLKFSYDNNFDHVPKDKVYNYFKTELVDKNHLSLNDLHEYLIMAFQEKKPPIEKLKLKGSLGKGIIRKIFYRYYNEIAQDKHGLKYNYCQLLGEYFNGFDTDIISRNFNN